MMQSSNIILALSSKNANAATTTTTTPSLPLSEMIIVVGHGGTKRGCDDCYNRMEAEEDKGDEEEFSPLTCPPSQPAWWEGSNVRDAEVEVREEKEEKEEKTHSYDHYVNVDKPLPFADKRPYMIDPIKINEDDDNDDEEREPRMEEVDANAQGSEERKQPQPPTGKGGSSPGLVRDYKKAVLKGGRRDTMSEDENVYEFPEGQHPHLWTQNKRKPTWTTNRHDEDHSIGARSALPLSLSLNAAMVASAATKLMIIRKRSKEVPALALAAEYDANNEEVGEGVDEEAEDTKQQQQLQRGTKLKVAGPTALALAENDKPGEINSYIGNSKAAEERKQRVLALATCCIDDEPELTGLCNVNCGIEAAVGVDAAPGDLSCTSDEKQSVPSLSLAFSGDAANTPTHSYKFSEGDAAIAAHESTTTATKSSINEMICAIRHEFHALGKVLLSPISQSTLKNAIIVHCVHANCKACLKGCYNPPTVKPAKKKNKRYAVSPPPKPKAECPVSNTRNPGKRSCEASPHLDELAKAYNLMGRGFSFGPIKYTENVLMAQLEPDEDVNFGTEHEDTEESKVQHLQVAKVVHSAFVEQTEIHQSTPDHSNTTSRLVLSYEDKIKVQRYEQIAKVQQSVVRSDEQLLSKGAKRGSVLRGMRQIVDAVKIVFVRKTEATSTNASLARIEEVNTSAMDKVDAVVEASITAVESVKVSGNEPIGDNLNFRGEETSEARIGDDDIQGDDPTSGVDDFFSSREEIRDESQSKHYTAREDIQSSLSSESHTIIIDGSTLQKDPGQESFNLPTTKASLRGSYVSNLERSSDVLREALGFFGRVATARTCPIVFHDGNTFRFSRNQTKSYQGLPFFSTDFDDTSKSEKISPLASASVEEQLSDVHTCGEKPHATENVTVGSIVSGQTTTLSSIHKPGGVASVAKIYPSACNSNSTKFVVGHGSGGKEKEVDESFVTFDVNHFTTNEEGNDNSITTQGCKSHDKMSRHRIAVEESEPVVPSFPIYLDEDLKHKRKDVLKFARISPTKKKEKIQKRQHPQQTTKAPIEKALKTLKRVLIPSIAMPKLPQMKKRRLIVDAKDDVKSSVSSDKSNTIPTLNDVLRSLSIDEIVSRADSRYNALLSSFDTQSTSVPQVTLHAVTSSLSESDLELLDSFCQFLKGKPVVLKLMKYFNPNKTQICITSASSRSHQSSGPIDVVSSHRTLKVMRSTLNGIPILTPAWMEACMNEGHLVSPTGTMCIRSLPRKQGKRNAERGLKNSNEQFGVAKYAAAFNEMELLSTRHVLSGISVLLCARSAHSGMKKDIKVLLKQAGASILGSESMASRQLTAISEGALRLPIVFLCGDSPMDESFGISDALSKQTEQLLKGTSTASVHCVAFRWLFDSISCAAPMKTSAYEPAAPRARALWKLATTRQVAVVHHRSPAR